MVSNPIQNALDALEILPPEDQECVVEMIHARLIEQRRNEIFKHAQETLRAFQEGRTKTGTFMDLKKDLLEGS